MKRRARTTARPFIQGDAALRGASSNRVPCIAVAQTCPVAGDVAENIAEHVRLARLAAAEGALVAVFPELSLTGYELELAPGLAFGRQDRRLKSLKEAAKDLQITLLVGAPVAAGSGLNIGTFVIRPDGVIDLYTKRRLGSFPEAARVDGIPPPPEMAVFRPGSDDPLVRVGGHVAALAICADVGDPDHAARAAARGASMYLASMFVIRSDQGQEAARLASCATVHRLVVAMANYGSPSGRLISAGGSSIWSPSGEYVVRLPSTGSGVAVAAQGDGGWQSTVSMLDPDSAPGSAAVPPSTASPP